ncbi:hypothetical protein FRC01_003433 [Tulasnella sp. 417]|nr:hypothetical protein FRC01_003433 [Tulasnella sp. 417]
MAQANRHLQDLVTPSLYRNITIPGKEGPDIELQQAGARLIRTLSERPSLAVLVREIENAPSILPIGPLETIWAEGANTSEPDEESSGRGAHTRTQLCRVPLDVMRSCVNLQSLSVVEAGSYLYFVDQCQWLNFLLDPSTRLKSLKFHVNTEGQVNEGMWNYFFGSILDIQVSLEHLECPISNRKAGFEEGHMETWVPNLRVLGGDHLGPFRALLSNKRSIEKLVVHSIPMEDISSLFAERLEAVDTVTEIIYWEPEEDQVVDFPALFGTMPSLRTFRGEMWLDFSTEDDFLQELLKAFALTPHLTEFEIEDSSYPLADFFDVAQVDISAGIALEEADFLRDQAAWLRRYSKICPELRSFRFPGGKRWARISDQWILQARFSRNNGGPLVLWGL